MAVTARRTFANVKSSAISPRQPDVPNLMGETIFAGAAMDRYSTRSIVAHKDEGKGEKHSSKQEEHEGWILRCARHLRLARGGAEDRTEHCGEEARGLRECVDARGVHLPLEGKGGAISRGAAGDKDHISPPARIAKRNK